MDSRSTMTRVAGTVLLGLNMVAPAGSAGGPNSIGPGDLDPSFGTQGRVLTQPAFNAALYAVAVQPDGRIVGAGMVHRLEDDDGGHTKDFALVRYNPDGTLDPSFGGDGLVHTDFGGTDDVAYAIALQPDGKIVAAGKAGFNGFALARYTPNGTLDLSFSGNGRVVTESFGGEARAVLVQPDGRIVAAGFTHNSFDADFAVARYSADGNLDASFADQGTYWLYWQGGDEEASAVVIQDDGRIVVVGSSKFEDGDDMRTGVVRLRLDPDGNLESTQASVDFFEGSGQHERAYAAALQPDGKLVVGGALGSHDFALRRFHVDGSLDTAFGTNGLTTADFGGSLDAGTGEVRALLVQADGRIVAAGFAHGPYQPDRFAVARYGPDGGLDPSFSSDGTVSIGFPNTLAFNRAYGAAVQADGRVVIAGEVDGRAFALARLAGGPRSPAPVMLDWTAGLTNVEDGPPAGANPHGRAVFRVDKEGPRMSFRLHLANIEAVTSAGVYTVDRAEDDPAGGGRLRPRVSLFDPRSCQVYDRNVQCEDVIDDPGLIRDLTALMASGRTYVIVTTEANPLGELEGAVTPRRGGDPR